MTWLWLVVLGALAAIAQFLRPAEVQPPLFEPKRKLLLVTLIRHGDEPLAIAEWAAELMASELNLEVELRNKPILIPRDCLLTSRGQGNAVTLVELVEKFVRPDLAVLGLTEYDLHSPLRRDLTFALGARKGWAGLVSTFRMADRKRPENTLERLKKMLVRYGAELVCDADRIDDPQSVLYNKLQSPEQLDIMILPSQ